MFITILSSIIWLIIIPFGMGLPLAKRLQEDKMTISSVLVCGMLVYTSLFQVAFVAILIINKRFSPLVYTFIIVTLLISAWSLGRNRKLVVEIVKGMSIPRKEERLTWFLMIISIGFQLYQTAMYQFIDGDDAFYGATATMTVGWDKLYQYIPYTGMPTGLDVRHSFSGAPIFVAFLSEVVCAHAATVHHIILPIAIVVMMYVIYYKIACEFWKTDHEKKKIPIFVLTISLLYLYGNTSIYTAATFLLTRTAQGKSIIANLVVPATVYCLLRIQRNLEEKKSCQIEIVLLSFCMMMGGFCTMLGLVLIPMLTVVALLILGVLYKKKSVIIWQIMMLVPTYVLGLIYLLLAK